MAHQRLAWTMSIEPFVSSHGVLENDNRNSVSRQWAMLAETTNEARQIARREEYQRVTDYYAARTREREKREGWRVERQG